MNGVECVRQLKRLLPATQFVVLPVHEDSDHIFQALQAGAGGSPMMTNIARKVVKAFHQIAPPKPAIATLSARENEVLQMLAQGYLY